MKRLLAPIFALLFTSAGMLAGPPAAFAAPLPAPYAASAGGDVAAFDLTTAGLSLSDARLATTSSASGSTLTPRSTASAANLAAAVAGLGIAVQENQQVAPPLDPGPETEVIAAASAPGLLDLGALTTTVESRYTTDDACVPGNLLADSLIESVGASLEPAGIGNLFSTGDAATRGITSLQPTTGLNRAVRGQAVGEISGASFLGRGVSVAITNPSTLTATASGVPGGASVEYDPGTITVTANGSTTTLAAGASETFTVGGNAVTLTANSPTVTEAANGQTATGSVAVVTATVRVGPAGAPLARSTIDLLPLRASATAPTGGVDCPPPAPVLSTPADGTETTDSTPTFTGTGVPGAVIDLTVSGTVFDDAAVVAADGTFTFTPGTPLAVGTYAASVTQETAGGVSASSNVNDFTILPPAPVLTTPADGTVTSDPTPTFAGTATPGAIVEVFVDGSSIGTGTAGPEGDYALTPTTPLAAGGHRAYAVATVNGIDSGPSSTNDFAVDAAAPAAPVLERPADGSVTDDTTPTFSGTAEPGAEVEIFVDGAAIGATTAGPDGRYAFTPTTPLAAGQRSAYAVATDPAGNVSARSTTNAFVVDVAAPAAPEITSPADGATITDPTPVIRGTGEPGATVTVYVDGERIGSATVAANGGFAVPVREPLEPGVHAVTAVQADPAGNTSRAARTRFTLAAAGDDAAPAAPVITAPADGSGTADSTPTIGGTAEPGSLVTVIVDGEQVGRVRADADGAWSLGLPDPLSVGDHVVTALAADAAGNVSEPAAEVRFRVLDGAEAAENLASTGGPAWWIAGLGGLLLAGGAALAGTRLRARRTAD